MNKKEELKNMLKGIEEEIGNLKRQKDELPDYENRVEELEKEAEELRRELKR